MMNSEKKRESEPFLPYGRQSVDEEDIAAVCSVLGSEWLTTGPMVDAFERRVAALAGVAHGVAVSSGTAALHGAMNALEIGAGDEVIVPSMTFAATANAVVYQGGTPVFADVESDTLLIDPESVSRCISARTRAIVAMDYAGQPCNYDRLKAIARDNGLYLVADACHSLGAGYKGCPAGSLADMSIFSFHPVKHITTGEGGMVLTDDLSSARKMRSFRNHGIDADSHARCETGTWYYEISDLGFNYRMTDIQCALGISQLKKLDAWIERRQSIAGMYDDYFRSVPDISPLALRSGIVHAYHLYVLRLETENPRQDRLTLFNNLRSRGIGVNVHYIPVHFHPFYRRMFHTREGLCPVAEDAYERILSIPIFPEMTDHDVKRVCTAVKQGMAGL